jgi:predicted NACHT family NTPase
VNSGQQLLELRGHTQGVVCVAFSRDGQKVITGGDDKTAIVWDATTGQRLLNVEGHTAGVTSVAFAPDGRRALTASLDATAKLWDIDRQRMLAAIGSSAAASGPDQAKELLTLKAHDQPVTSVNFSPDGRYVLTASRDGTAILWLATDWHPIAPASQQASVGK